MPSDSDAQILKRTHAGVLWSVATGLLTRLVGLVATLVLTRYMSPEQSGSVNVALTLVNLISIMSTVGLGQFLASQAQPSPRAAWNATQIHLSLGAIAFSLTLLFGAALARRFGAPDSSRYIPLLVLTFTLERIVYVPERVLIAHMRFRQLGVLRAGAELVFASSAVIAALCGAGPWSLVAGNLARQVWRLALVLHYTPRRDWLLGEGPDGAIMKRLLRFGLPVMIASIAGFASRRCDNLLVSRYYGESVLGLYNLAYNLAEVPALQLTDMVTDALAPSFARLSRPERQRAMTDIMTALAFCVFPLAIGLGLCAPTLSRLLAARWAGVGAYLAILSVLSLSRPVTMIATVYLQALRQPTVAAVLYVAQVAVLLSALFLVGHRYPARPLLSCYAVGATFAIGSAAAIGVLRLVDEVPLWPLLRAHLLPTPALITMTLALWGLSRGLPASWLTRTPLALLGVQVIVGGLAYVGAALVFLPGPTRQLLQAVRSLRQQRQS